MGLFDFVLKGKKKNESEATMPTSLGAPSKSVKQEEPFFESSFEIPFKFEFALKNKTIVCSDIPDTWKNTCKPCNLSEALKHFEEFYKNCVSTVKQEKQKSAGNLGKLLPTGSDDFDAVFSGIPYIIDSKCVGLIVKFNGRSAINPLRSTSFDDSFSILCIGADKYLSMREVPEPISKVSEPKKQEPVIEVKIPSASSKLTGVETITDIEGNIYTSVKIGNQVWTVENFKATKYNDGTPIPLIVDSKWMKLSTGAHCWYGNNSTNKEKYGALYNWYAVNSGKLAPIGWHVPTDEECTELEKYLIANGCNWDGTKEGNKIAKALAAKKDWTSNSDSGTIGNDLSKNNLSGFSAIPSGYRDDTGLFFDQNNDCRWWTATECDASSAWSRFLSNCLENLLRFSYPKQLGFCARSIRDS